jgi:hypothetical protein
MMARIRSAHARTSRRQWLAGAAAADASTVATGAWSQGSAPLPSRRIPSSGERLPAVGLGN